MLEKPEKPTPNECCGGGSCCPCVWDAYFDNLKAWQEQEKASGESSTNSKIQHNKSKG